MAMQLQLVSMRTLTFFTLPINRYLRAGYLLVFFQIC